MKDALNVSFFCLSRRIDKKILGEKETIESVHFAYTDYMYALFL